MPLGNKPGPFTKKLMSDTSHLRGIVNIKKNQDDSTQWLQDQIHKIAQGTLELKKAPSSRRANQMSDGFTNRLRIGNLYFFVYNALTAEKLPYWDAYPLIIPTSYRSSGNFFAMNLHYLPPTMRAYVLDQIYDMFESRGMLDQTKYKITQSMLRYLSTLPEFKPCIKQYRPDRVCSLFNPVAPEQWSNAIMTSNENFQKASKSKVWQDSLNIIANGYKGK